MNSKLRKFFSGAVAVIAAAAMAGAPVSAASAQTARYRAASNQALIDDPELIGYAQGITKYYFGQYYSGYTRTDTTYTDSTLTTALVQSDWNGNDITHQIYKYGYTYGSTGSITASTFLNQNEGNSSQTTYSYDAADHLARTEQLDRDSDGEESASAYVTDYAYTYNADGVLLQKNELSRWSDDSTGATFPSATSYIYDKFGRISDISIVAGEGDNQIEAKYHYTYKNNRVVRIKGYYLDQSDNYIDYRLQYDSANRLVSASNVGEAMPGGKTVNYQFAYGEGNALTAITQVTTELDGKGKPYNDAFYVKQYIYTY